MRGTTIGLSIFLLLDIGLADDDQRSALTRLEQGFHGGQRDRLMLRQVASLAVARGPDQRNDKDQRGGHANLQKDFCLLHMPLAEQIESAHGHHDKSAGHTRAGHVVRVLPERPRIQHQAPEAGERHGAISGARIGHRMLHPGIGGNDEVARQPGADKHGHGRPPVGDSG